MKIAPLDGIACLSCGATLEFHVRSTHIAGRERYHLLLYQCPAGHERWSYEAATACWTRQQPDFAELFAVRLRWENGRPDSVVAISEHPAVLNGLHLHAPHGALDLTPPLRFVQTGERDACGRYIYEQSADRLPGEWSRAHAADAPATCAS